LVLNILSKGSPFHVRASNYYNSKYLYKVRELSDTTNEVTLEFVVNLTCKLNDELDTMVRKLTSNSVIAEPIGFGEVIAEASLNNRQLPVASEMSETPIYGINVEPINYGIPAANFVVVNNGVNSSLSEQANSPVPLPVNEVNVNSRRSRRARRRASRESVERPEIRSSGRVLSRRAISRRRPGSSF